ASNSAPANPSVYSFPTATRWNWCEHICSDTICRCWTNGSRNPKRKVFFSAAEFRARSGYGFPLRHEVGERAGVVLRGQGAKLREIKQVFLGNSSAFLRVLCVSALIWRANT